MADRADSPAGTGYALENRLITNQCLSSLFQHSHVERLASFSALRKRAAARASHRMEDPRIVLLSPGPQAAFYFEDVFLARYLGYTLVEGGDLAVRNDRVFLKTLDGLLPVDVIYCRGSERGVDPLDSAARGATACRDCCKRCGPAMWRLPTRRAAALSKPPSSCRSCRVCANTSSSRS